MLDKGSVEGAHSIKAHHIAYFGYRPVGFEKMLTGIGYSYGVDVVVKAICSLSFIRWEI